MTALLPAPQYVKFNRDALFQSTTLARYEAHRSALENRWRTVSEIRDIEELPPVAWGDLPNEKPTTGSEPMSNLIRDFVADIEIRSDGTGRTVHGILVPYNTRRGCPTAARRTRRCSPRRVRPRHRGPQRRLPRREVPVPASARRADRPGRGVARRRQRAVRRVPRGEDVKGRRGAGTCCARACSTRSASVSARSTRRQATR